MEPFLGGGHLEVQPTQVGETMVRNEAIFIISGWRAHDHSFLTCLPSGVRILLRVLPRSLF